MSEGLLGEIIYLQQQVGQFTRECVPSRAALYALKAQHEAEELAWACDNESDDRVAEEAADVLICLIAAGFGRGFSFGAVVRAACEKIQMNLIRRWEIQPDGTYQHNGYITEGEAQERREGTGL